jgi:pseudoazurin
MRVLVLLLLTLVCDSALSTEYEVKMLNQVADGSKMVFEPAILHVEVGDVVTFIPVGNAHDSISMFTPEGASSWHGRRDQKVSVTIDKEGIYIYKCAPHFYYGMMGVIQAGKATNIHAAKEFADSISHQFIAHKNRLINYLETIK